MNEQIKSKLTELLLDAFYHTRAAEDAYKKAQQIIQANNLRGNFYLGIVEESGEKPKETAE